MSSFFPVEPYLIVSLHQRRRVTNAILRCSTVYVTFHHVSPRGDGSLFPFESVSTTSFFPPSGSFFFSIWLENAFFAVLNVDLSYNSGHFKSYFDVVVTIKSIEYRHRFKHSLGFAMLMNQLTRQIVRCILNPDAAGECFHERTRLIR